MIHRNSENVYKAAIVFPLSSFHIFTCNSALVATKAESYKTFIYPKALSSPTQDTISFESLPWVQNKVNLKAMGNTKATEAAVMAVMAAMAVVAVVRIQISQVRHISPTVTMMRNMEAFVTTAGCHLIIW